MRELLGKVAFITGGASGIGFALAKLFAQAGLRVVIADINQDHLDRAARQLDGAEVHFIRLNVTDRQAMSMAADETERVFGKVHILCNNAGVNLFSDIGTADYDDWDWVMGINVGGVINGITTFISRIKSHGEGGHIVNTASMASFIASAEGGIYCTSKFAVRGMSEALRWSLMPCGIGVSVLCPGLVNTLIYLSEQSPRRHLSGNTTPVSTQYLERLARAHQAGMTADEIAVKVLAAIQQNQFYILSHPEFKDELHEIFDEALRASPKDPTPSARLEFEQRRRARRAKARAAWPQL